MNRMPDSGRFTGKTVLVTGAAGTLGQAVVHCFLEEGAELVCFDLHLDLLLRAFGNVQRTHLRALDLRSRSSCEAAVGLLGKEGRRPQILTNIAGGFRMGEAVHETSDETWDFLFDLNLGSILNMAAAAVPGMQDLGGGRIINVAAMAGLGGAAGMGAYSASKAGVIRLTESMAAELGHRNINVNCVLPGIMDTPVNRRDMPDADFSAWTRPLDIARVIRFLASDEAVAIQGAAIPVTGSGPGPKKD